jgi:hypothetical protein
MEQNERMVIPQQAQQPKQGGEKNGTRNLGSGVNIRRDGPR